MDLTFLLVKAKSERIRLSRALLPFTPAWMTSALPPPPTSKTSLSSPPLLPQLSLGKGNPLTSDQKKKGGKSGIRPSRIFPQPCDVLCVKVWLPWRMKGAFRQRGLGGEARRGVAISEEGEGRRPSCGAACRPSPRTPGSPPPFGADCIRSSPHQQPLPTRCSPASHSHPLARPQRVSNQITVILLLGDASPLRIHGSRWFSCSGYLSASRVPSPPLLRVRSLTEDACH